MEIVGAMSNNMPLQAERKQPPALSKMTWESTPLKSTKRESGYRSSVIEKKLQGNSRLRTESQGLELKRVVEVGPNSPYTHHDTSRATSLPRHLNGYASITVRASDFIKYRKDLAMLRACQIQPGVYTKESEDIEEAPAPWIDRDPWRGIENPEKTRKNFDDAGLDQVWFPPSPKKESESEASTRLPSPMSAVWRETPDFPTLLRCPLGESSPRPQSCPDRKIRRAGSLRPPSARSNSKESTSTCESASSGDSDNQHAVRSARGKSLPPVAPPQTRRTSAYGTGRATPDNSSHTKQRPQQPSRSPREHENHGQPEILPRHPSKEHTPRRASSRGRPPRPGSAAKPSHWR